VGVLPEVVVGEPEPPRHRRRERRRTGAAPPVPAEAPSEYAARSGPAPAEEPAPVAEPAPAEEPAEKPPPVKEPPAATQVAAPKRKSRARHTDVERGLRGIVGAGPSQVGVLGAMRARDAAKPTAEEMAAAERDVVVVRRHYVAPDSLPGAR
jgi:predicted flap endonuclease-1-like 5' DNA nuclease